MYERKFKLRMIIPNFSKLDVLMSEPEEHFGVPWSLRMVQLEKGNCGAFLWCKKENDEQNPWSIDTNFSFNFPTVRKSELPVKTTSRKFTQCEGVGWHTVHPREKLLDAAIGDTLIFECDVTIVGMTGIAPQQRNHDENKKSTEITLEMGDESFNISRKFLATNFAYFHGMLFSGFSESKEEKLKLDDVDPKLFHRILEFIDTPIILPEDDLVGIVELSAFLGNENVVAQFEKAIVKDDRIAKKDKFRLADTHNLPLLKNQCLNNISDLDSLRAHSPKYIFDLNHSTLAHIMHKVIHGFGLPAGPKDQTDAPVQEVERKFKLRHVVQNFSEFEEEWSEREEHFGEQWDLCIEVMDDDTIGFFLFCNREEDEENPWEIQATFNVTFPCINRTELLEEVCSVTFGKEDGWGQSPSIDWFMPAVVDDVLVMECDVTITKMTGIPRKKTVTFHEPMESGSAITLEVGDQKFSLSKTFLSFHSSYFKSLYSRKGAKLPEIDLKELNSEDFQLLLEVLHDHQVLNDDNVVGVLNLAAVLGMKKVLDQCEKIVIGSGKVSMKQKLRLADENNLQHLMGHCLNNTNTFSDLKAYMPINVFDLQKNTLAMFLNKVINHF